MKKYILIQDFNLNSNNRGTAALGYGSISFLREKGYLTDEHVIVNIRYRRSLIEKSVYYTKIVQGVKIDICDLYPSRLEYKILLKTGKTFGFSKLAKVISNLTCVAALNGGDGFSDIYGQSLYKSRLPYTYIAMKCNIPLIIMPQTIGPFKDPENYKEAESILKYAKEVYVRDDKFVEELNKMGVNYQMTKDLSAYMQPEAWDIDIKPNSVGINVSGLAYSNKFLDTAGQFETYPIFIERLINKFRADGTTVYLIPHSYNVNNPETNNDDIEACSAAYNRLAVKTDVVYVDKDLISPQVKYVISQMSFFIGTRMHANFAAIYTNVPVFGLAYSYKFEGAFKANGLSADQCFMINNMREDEIDDAIEYIYKFYKLTKK